MKIKPLSDRVIVKAEAAEEKTASGIILPDTAKEKPQEGEVVAVGPGKISDSGNTIKMTVKVGDKVLYGKYSGTEVTVGNQEYLIMKENDIFAIL
jgi:chaperonin GroES